MTQFYHSVSDFRMPIHVPPSSSTECDLMSKTRALEIREQGDKKLKVYPYSIDTLDPMTAVSPITIPVP